MKFSLFNIYVIVIIIWFIYNFLKKRKEVMARQKRKTEQTYKRENNDYNKNESDDDVLRKLKNIVEWESKNEKEDESQELIKDILSGSSSSDDDEKDEYDNEYVETVSTTSKEEESKLYIQKLSEKQKMYEELANKISKESKPKEKYEDKYEYNINKRNAISIFKASSEDLQKAIVYKAILERRGKKVINIVYEKR